MKVTRSIPEESAPVVYFSVSRRYSAFRIKLLGNFPTEKFPEDVFLLRFDIVYSYILPTLQKKLLPSLQGSILKMEVASFS
jgi:hypothetical protein